MNGLAVIVPILGNLLISRAFSIKQAWNVTIAITAVVWMFAATAATASAANEAISGKVMAEEGGAPVPEARVCAAEFAGPLESEWKCTTAKTDGTYELGLEPGNYRVKFEQGESGMWLVRRYYPGVDQFEEATEVTVTEHEQTTGIDGALEAGGAIAGQVIAEGSFLELRGVEVCSSWQDEFEYCEETNSNGFYEITGLHTGPHVVEFWAPELGFETQFAWGEVRYSDADPVYVLRNQYSTGTNAVMSRLGTISGHVYSATNHRPLGEILVCAIGAVDGELQDCEETGPTGAYQLRFVPGGASKVAFSPEYREFFPDEEPNADGWPTQFWNLKSTLSDSDVINVVHGGSVTGIDGLLGYVPPAAGTSSPPSGITLPPSVVATPRPKPLNCRKGFVKRQVKGKQRCLRRARHHRHRRHPAAH
jgi:hypothetical protein